MQSPRQTTSHVDASAPIARPVSRRELLALLLGSAPLGAAIGCAARGESRSADSRLARATGLIRRENERPGTRDWLLTKTAVDPATKYRCPWIEGYVSHTSLRAGETLTFHVSTRPPSPFTIDLYRLGYYGGTGGRFLTRLGPFPGVAQPDPPVGSRRLRDCE